MHLRQHVLIWHHGPTYTWQNAPVIRGTRSGVCGWSHQRLWHRPTYADARQCMCRIQRRGAEEVQKSGNLFVNISEEVTRLRGKRVRSSDSLTYIIPLFCASSIEEVATIVKHV
jgi:hypothetical protein